MASDSRYIFLKVSCGTPLILITDRLIFFGLCWLMKFGHHDLTIFLNRDSIFVYFSVLNKAPGALKKPEALELGVCFHPDSLNTNRNILLILWRNPSPSYRTREYYLLNTNIIVKIVSGKSIKSITRLLGISLDIIFIFQSLYFALFDYWLLDFWTPKMLP